MKYVNLLKYFKLTHLKFSNQFFPQLFKDSVNKKDICAVKKVKIKSAQKKTCSYLSLKKRNNFVLYSF